MAEFKTYVCDECGVEKREANHWFKAYPWHSGHFEIARWDANCVAPHDAPLVERIALHLCSEQCAAKAMSKAIGAGK